MKTKSCRGIGPWPRENSDSEVTNWLVARLSEVEEDERIGMARWLLEHISGQGRGERFVSEMRWHESQLDRLAILAEKLNSGEPIQYVLGEVWFDGLKLHLTRDVLIPRPETEELVAAMSDKVSSLDNPGRVADWCTGSGCMALAMKRRLPSADVVGYELSEEALVVARTNALSTRLDVDFVCADALQAEQPEVPFNVVMSNPPYIPSSERPTMQSRVTEHEPALALFVPDEDPLLFFRALVAWCERGALLSRGWIGLECHWNKAEEVGYMLTTSEGWTNVEILSDLQGLPRHVVAQRMLT